MKNYKQFREDGSWSKVCSICGVNKDESQYQAGGRPASCRTCKAGIEQKRRDAGKTIKHKKPTMEYVAALFNYKDGRLFWREPRANNKVKAGDLAGVVNSAGYLLVKIDGWSFSVHKIIWFIHYETESDYLDHIDKDRLNNNISNLREVNHMQNMNNKSAYLSNTSGSTGVRQERTGRWAASIQINKKTKTKYFSTREEAIHERKRMERERDEAIFGASDDGLRNTSVD